METLKRYSKALICSIGWFILFIMLQTILFVVSFIFKLVFDNEYLNSVKLLIEQANNNTDELINSYMQIIGGLTFHIEVSLAIFVIIFFIIDRHIHKQRFSFNKIEIIDIPQFISLGIIINILSLFFINIFSQDALEDTGYNVSLLMQGSFLSILISVGICAPICEEIIFRYFIYHNLNRANQVFAIIVSAGLFGVAHGNIIQGMYVFEFGLIFAILNIKYNSIIPGLIMHISVNCLSTILTLFDSSVKQIVFLAILLLVSVTITIITYIIKFKNKI